MRKLKSMDTKVRGWLTGVFVLFFLLFNAPFIYLPKGTVGGVPSILIYIVTNWVLVTFFMWWFSTKSND